MAEIGIFYLCSLLLPQSQCHGYQQATARGDADQQAMARGAEKRATAGRLGATGRRFGGGCAALAVDWIEVARRRPASRRGGGDW
uniref:DUF834 domain-containing protein n=1 Tax=Oryza glumipatula TaxID=40148 RepID=A0A0D9Y7N0_9ORYZ